MEVVEVPRRSQVKSREPAFDLTQCPAPNSGLMIVPLPVRSLGMGGTTHGFS
jgi:hypothetical protein